MPTPSLVAIVISDLHLSLLKPACRADKDWMAVQAGYLKQVRDLAREEGDVPVLCSGDLFDRWNPPPELINFALKHLPDEMVSIPGQHDLPNHRLDGVHRSGYGVLMEAGKIHDISNRTTFPLDTDVAIHGFAWNQEIRPFQKEEGDKKWQIALIHRYFWTEDKKYPGAPDTANVSAFKKQLKGYDIAFTGDNHKRWAAEAGDCRVFNIGGFIRRKFDEIGRKPAMALLYSDGDVKWRLLDTSGDQFHEGVVDRPETPLNMKEFIAGLESLGEEGLDFKAAVENHLRSDDIDEDVKLIVRRSLEAHAN